MLRPRAVFAIILWPRRPRWSAVQRGAIIADQRRTHTQRDSLSIHSVYMTTTDVPPRTERCDAFIDWLGYGAS